MSADEQWSLIRQLAERRKVHPPASTTAGTATAIPKPPEEGGTNER
jgi:hypothetical protein